MILPLRPYSGSRRVGGLTPFAEAVASAIDYRGSDACWQWHGSIDATGYGRFGARNQLAHRIVYELLVGPIPDGLTLDHTCHNIDRTCPGGNACMHRRCVNPAHLEPVTQRANIMRGRGLASAFASRDRCLHGHEFTPENTYRSPKDPGARYCRACRRRLLLEYRQRQRDALIAAAPA